MSVVPEFEEKSLPNEQESTVYKIEKTLSSTLDKISLKRSGAPNRAVRWGCHDAEKVAIEDSLL